MIARRRKREWPPWWNWKLFLIDHIYESMEKRHFTEIDLRRMMEKASGYHRGIVEGRWVLETRHDRQKWEVIVEPNQEKEVLEVVTAYALWEE